jgi:hypothetical protein
MTLSKENALALMLDIHQDIEEYSEAAVKNIIEEKKFDFVHYPPNGGLTESERTELNKLENNEDLKSALRKLLANNASGIVFNMLSLFDGITEVKNNYDSWTGIQLNDQPEYDENNDEYREMLHDKLYETYWDWRKIRGNKSWKLDNYEG